MARKRVVEYYNERYKGSLTDESCNFLETIISMKEQRTYIPELKNTIYALSESEVARIRESGVVDEDISTTKGELTNAQTLGVAFMYHARNCILGDSVGLGKTVQVASLLNIIRKERKDEDNPFRFLYLTEKTIVDQAINKLIQFTRGEVYELSGEKPKNEKWRKQFPYGHTGGIVAPHSLLNQQVFYSWLADVSDLMEYPEPYFDVLVVDESSVLGNTSTQIYKNAQILRKYCKQVILLNATPFEKNLDVYYAQLNYLDSTLLPTKTEFGRQFKVMTKTPFQRFPTLKGYKNADLFKHQVGYHYFYHTREELGAEIKNTHYELKTAPMTDEQKELMTWTTMYNYVYDCPNILNDELSFTDQYVPKLGLLEEVIEDYMGKGQQLLIFCHYKEAQRHLQDWLEVERGFTVEILNGDITNRNERNQIVQDFVNKEYDILITSVQKGLDFGDVENLVFYSFSTNPNKMIQMEGRITRSFHVENKNIFILANEGRELNALRKTVKSTLQASREFSSADISGVVEILLNELS